MKSNVKYNIPKLLYDRSTIIVSENYFLIIFLLIFFYTMPILLLFYVLNSWMIATSSIQFQL